MKIIGITGGTGCGKTTALQRLAALGGEIIDCDAVYHELLETDKDLLAALDARFPEAMEDGKLNRKKLGNIVFADPDALHDLDNIILDFVNREVWRRIELARAAGKPAVAVDAINLLGGELEKHCDVTVAVVAPVEDRVRRLIAREGISEEYARKRINAQKPNEYFMEHCDVTFVNDCDTPEEFGARCDTFYQRLLKEEGNQA
jgi:dephospho-CoA kinase